MPFPPWDTIIVRYVSSRRGFHVHFTRRDVITTQFASRITYPNPFKPSGIEFDLPEDSLVTLTLLDHLGNELSQLITDRFYKAGTHTIDLTPNGYSKGIYFYRLSIIIRGKTFTDTKRIVIEH